jgi:stage II sporulation protein D
MKWLRLLTAGLLAFPIGSCAPSESAPSPEVLTAVSRGPLMRIGIGINVDHAVVASDGAIAITDPDEGVVRTTAPGGALTVTTHGGDVVARDGDAAVQRAVLRLDPADSNAPLRIDGRAYRGAVEVRRGDSGIVVINRVALEDYLVGVVGAEMGKRVPGEEAALRAQAVASRTYAVRNSGRNAAHGFDLAASASDQVYAGMADDTPLAAAAVAATRGEILTWNGQPIDAFFFAACGGRTEDGTAAFAGADRPYLRSVDDHDGHGVPWCIDAPRLRWTATWKGDALAATLRRTLAAEHLAVGQGDLRDIQILHHTATDRVAAIAVTWRSGRTVVSGQGIRRVLPAPEGGWLRSTDFTLRIDRNGGRIERVEIDGVGNGHGVGMCQWGAIGRARAGQDYRTILASYFPGTEIQQLY